MLKKILSGSLSALSFSTLASGQLAFQEKYDACSKIDSFQINIDTGRSTLVNQVLNFDLIKDDDVSYMLLGTTTKISDKKCIFVTFQILVLVSAFMVRVTTLSGR